MDTLQAILLGIVQGITEFLPVSSSGYLQIAKELLGVELEENLTFDVTLHAATVLSTIVVLWSEVWRLLKGLFSRRFNEEQAYVLKLVISMIPIGIVGFLLKDRINEMLDAPYILVIVGAMLLLTAGLLAFGPVALGLWYAGGVAALGGKIAVGVAAVGETAVGYDAAGKHVLLWGNGLTQPEVEAFLLEHHPSLWKPLLKLLAVFGASIK